MTEEYDFEGLDDRLPDEREYDDSKVGGLCKLDAPDYIKSKIDEIISLSIFVDSGRDRRDIQSKLSQAIVKFEEKPIVYK